MTEYEQPALFEVPESMATPEPALKDFRGTPIEVGSTITYPGRVSSSMWVNEGVVQEITTRTDWYGTNPVLIVVRTASSDGDLPNGKPVTLTKLNNVVVVTPRT